MHPGHLAPTYHQSMTDLALIEVRIVAQFYPEPADGDHVKHVEQDDVQPRSHLMASQVGMLMKL